MKVIIAGSRSIKNYTIVAEAIELANFDITEVVSGGAHGVDRFGEEWAVVNGIPFVRFPALWNLYGKAAGYKRNQQMAEYADALIAVWDGKSKGTENMIELATQYNLKKYIHVENLLQF